MKSAEPGWTRRTTSLLGMVAAVMLGVAAVLLILVVTVVGAVSTARRAL